MLLLSSCTWALACLSSSSASSIRFLRKLFTLRVLKSVNSCFACLEMFSNDSQASCCKTSAAWTSLFLFLARSSARLAFS
uniref:Putative secreted protein n=1 Tax=Ixodes ricinus TaxID=34613 RepID=A0A6B0TVI3_IXORI